MNTYYPLLLVLAAAPALAQTASLTEATPLVSLPPDTLRLQGQRQPARPFLTVQDQLRTVAGVQVTPYDGSPGSGQVVRIRGAGEVRGLAQPLYVVDGLPALNDELTPDQWQGTTPVPSPYAPSNYTPASTVTEQHLEAGANPLQLLPPETIESIEILAGPAAVARYGPLGTNGVVNIRTRRAGSGPGSRPLRVRYAAYGGVQQVRHRYSLLKASEFASLANEAALNNQFQPPYPSTQLGAGTDWQAETYRLAGLQQHLLSVDGQAGRTGFLVSADYRQQAGVLRGSNLSRYGLRLALDQRMGERLTLRGTASLGETTQRLPYTSGPGGAVQGALQAPPTVPVRNAQGDYNGYVGYVGGYQPDPFANPVAVAEYNYRQPRTRRLLAQLAADYHPAPGFTVQAAGSYQRTLLDADYYNFLNTNYFAPPTGSQHYGLQTYAATQLAGRLAVQYARQVGRHHFGAELDYQYQQNRYETTTELAYTLVGGLVGNYFTVHNEAKLHRPWAGVRYALDSLLTVEAGVSLAHFRGADRTDFYPNAQVSWQPGGSIGPAGLPLALWVGAARTGLIAFGSSGLIGASLVAPPSFQYPPPLYTNQLEAGLRLGRPAGRLTGQLVAYQRTSQHVLLSTVAILPSQSGGFYDTELFLSEGTIRNQGLELTLAASWHAGPVQGRTRLVASANRNRVQCDEVTARIHAAFDNHPAGTFYGFRQTGLDSNGRLVFQDVNGDGQLDYRDQQYLGSGIPAALTSVSQQLRWSRWQLDAQADGLFGFQLFNQQLSYLDIPSGYGNASTAVLDRWTPTNTNTIVPAAGRESVNSGLLSQQTTNRLLESGNQLRLSSLTVSYALRPAARPDLSVWTGVQNLLVLSGYRGYDPNVSSGGSSPLDAGQDYGAVPVPRTWLLGVRASI